MTFSPAGTGRSCSRSLLFGFLCPHLKQNVSLLRREITCIQLIILSFRRNQLIMCTTLDDPSLFHNHDTVGILDCGQTVGNDKCGPPLHQCVHTCLHQFLGTGINGGCGLVQDQRRRVCHSRAGNGKKLSLPLAQMKYFLD